MFDVSVFYGVINRFFFLFNVYISFLMTVSSCRFLTIITFDYCQFCVGSIFISVDKHSFCTIPKVVPEEEELAENSNVAHFNFRHLISRHNMVVMVQTIWW